MHVAHPCFHCCLGEVLSVPLIVWHLHPESLPQSYLWVGVQPDSENCFLQPLSRTEVTR